MSETRHRMAATPGSHTAYARGGELVVEWYDFGEDLPYESANLLVFDAPGQAALAAGLELPPGIAAEDLAASVAQRFPSYWEAKAFAAAQGIAFRTEVDFTP